MVYYNPYIAGQYVSSPMYPKQRRALISLLRLVYRESNKTKYNQQDWVRQGKVVISQDAYGWIGHGL